MTRARAGVLIAGGGLAAQRCCETLRRHGFAGRIVVLCGEPYRPYDRPPLSKAVLSDAAEPTARTFRPTEWYQRHNVELLLAAKACELDAHARTVTVHRNGTLRRLRYDRLVIATGSGPRALPGLAPGGVVHELRSYDDALSLRAALRGREGPLAIIGAGLVGMEVAAAARGLGREVTLVEAAPTPLGRILPEALGRWIANFHRRHGVQVRLATTVRRTRTRPGGMTLELDEGGELEAATVLVAAGIEPATRWLAASGFRPGAIRTDERGRTSIPRVYAAGDAACAPDPYLGAAVATQHWEAAARQGAAVALTILGRPPAPRPPAMFWSDQHGRRIQVVGHAGPNCTVALDGDAASGEPFTAWMYGPRGPCAAMLVDRPEAVTEARRRIERALEPRGHAVAA
jgi:NADPH-dependent 2,4-dienoyl-CoA reductase/sulfur reductase-like enzyme